jgi:hypothetical protein
MRNFAEVASKIEDYGARGAEIRSGEIARARITPCLRIPKP